MIRNRFASFFRNGALAVALTLAAISASFAPATASAASFSDYFENKIADWFLRGQAFTPPATVYVALATTTGTDSACGTEVTGGSYARASIASSLANWSGTQGAGTTVASSGTSGTVSNNVALNYTTPTAGWGTVVEMCVYDAVTAGNLLWRNALTTSKTINTGDTVSFPAASVTLQFDN